MNLSKRIDAIQPSITLGITAKAKQMKAQGVDVVSFGAGEPDFDTPDHIKAAASEAIKSGFTKYTPSIGMPELRQAICDKFAKDNNISFKPEQIVVSCGAKHSLYSILQVLCNEGDEVIIASPFWVSYPEMAKAAGAKPVIVQTELSEGLKLTPELLKNALTKKTKAIIINSPSNPAGIAYSADELKALSDVIMSSDAYVISDEIYEKLVYDGLRHTSIASISEDMLKRTFVVNGVSKSYSMTGWRIGYLAAPLEAAQAIKRLQDHSTSNPASISQKAALAAISGSQDCVETMKEAFLKRRDLMMSIIDGIESLSYVKPEGAFYLFCDISKTGMGSMDFAEKLLDSKNVAVIPGIGFGWDNYVRLSFATSEENIKKGLERIKEFVEK